MLARLLSRSGMSAPGVASAAGSGRRVRNLNVLTTLRNSVVRPSRLLGVFASLVGSQMGSALFGVVFWILAARALTPEQVGVGAALVAAMNLLSTFGVLGIGTLLLERFKVASVTDRRALVSTGLGIAGMGGALFAAGWLALSAPAHLSGVLGGLSLSSALLLVGTTGVAAMCEAFDQAVIGMGVSGLQMRRNVVASIVRIAVFDFARQPKFFVARIFEYDRDMEVGDLLDGRHFEIAVALRAALPSSRFHFVRVWKRRAHDHVQRASRTELILGRAFDARADAI